LKVASATIARHAREHGLSDALQNAFILDLYPPIHITIHPRKP
jgi:hypothetical protein